MALILCLHALIHTLAVTWQYQLRKHKLIQVYEYDLKLMENKARNPGINTQHWYMVA